MICTPLYRRFDRSVKGVCSWASPSRLTCQCLAGGGSSKRCTGAQGDWRRPMRKNPEGASRATAGRVCPQAHGIMTVDLFSAARYLSGELHDRLQGSAGPEDAPDSDPR